VVQKRDAEGLIEMFGEAGFGDEPVGFVGPAALGSESTSKTGGRSPLCWENEPTAAGKLEKIRLAFLNSKQVSEVMMACSGMSMREWLDYAIRLMPKDVKVQGEVNFRHLLDGLAPIDKSRYRLDSKSGRGNGDGVNNCSNFERLIDNPTEKTDIITLEPADFVVVESVGVV
jgi:hypothetical protein